MNTNRKNLIAASLAALLAVAPALPVRANTERDMVQIASPSTRDFTAAKLAGQDVNGNDGKSLGTIKDFAVSVEGAPVYALVSEGGVLGMGEKLRLIPTSALQPAVARDRNGFMVQIDQANWNQMTTVERHFLDSGAYRLTRDQHERLASRFGDADDRSISFRDDGLQLIRAGALRGKEVRAGADEIGEIQDVVIDLTASSASVLLETDDDFLGSEQNILVPLNKLSLQAARADVIATSLTRDDFAHLQNQTASSSVMAEPSERPQVRKPAVVSDNQDLSPTGRANTRQDPEELLEIGARSVRDLLKAEPAFGNSRIDVKAKHGHLVLTGSVASEQLRDQIYDTAKGATGFPVLNNITVDLDKR